MNFIKLSEVIFNSEFWLSEDILNLSNIIKFSKRQKYQIFSYIFQRISSFYDFERSRGYFLLHKSKGFPTMICSNNPWQKQWCWPSEKQDGLWHCCQQSSRHRSKSSNWYVIALHGVWRGHLQDDCCEENEGLARLSGDASCGEKVRSGKAARLQNEEASSTVCLCSLGSLRHSGEMQND